LILPFLLALLAFITLLAILMPLLRGSRPAPSRASFDQAVYRDQLQELDRDIARGLITPTEADAARLEIQRRLLAADKRPPAPPRLTRSPVLAMIVFVIVVAGSVSSYLWLGAPNLPDEPFSARKDEAAQQSSPSTQELATEALAAKLKQNPSDAATWLLYGRNLSQLREWDKAENAYQHAIALGLTSPDILGDHAELMVMQAGGTVTPAAEAAFQQVLKADPTSGIARYYLSVAAMQAGEPRKAIDGFQALLAQMPESSPLRAQLGLKVAEAAHAAGIPVPELAKGPTAAQPATQAPAQPSSPQAPGPDAAAVANAANMTADQRQAMIRGMVANLATKQAADPSNLDGWLRLGRAYTVLHETDKAIDAYEKAAHLKPDDTSILLQEVQALLTDHTPAEKLPQAVIAVLKRAEAIDPEQPFVLWYLGLSAAQDAHPDQARDYWDRLLKKIPAGSDDARMVKSAIDSLSKR
jgi:cytochrome c-type biogenesis protein CcmH